MIFFLTKRLISVLTAESEITDEFGKVMLIDYRLRFLLTRKILDDHVGTFHWAHAENSPEEGPQGGPEIDERILLLRLQFRLLISLYHSGIILIEMT